MKNYLLDYNNNEEILMMIKTLLLNRYPIVDDRLHILYPMYNEPMTPEVDINFYFYNNDNKDITEIIFLDGTRISKSSTLDRLIINNLISGDVICDLINYLLTDHDYFKNIHIDDDKLMLIMGVNGCNENMHGISCGDITISFDFHFYPNKKKLLRKYLKIITTTFFKELQNTPTFKEEFSNFYRYIKNDFINSLSTEELRDFINLFNRDDLYYLINSLPDDRFSLLYNQYNEQKNIKKLAKN